jgi:(1->4)-alpha-D-glucan 1-alpha-D-glucosylmutase
MERKQADSIMSILRIPLATYRLQFNHIFTFKQALEFISYFNELGITDLYASPLMKSVAGSMHGYDIVDCCQLNPEIGTEEEFSQMIQALQTYSMGLLLDIVPNHMCISDSNNKWWQDVLENGPFSLYAEYFNIIWNPPKIELKNKVLLPVLDQQYGKVIENQELKVVYEAGAFFVAYKAQLFPVNPATCPTILNLVVEQLLQQLDETNSDLLELQSIITALEHLPGGEEIDIEKRKERHREKEIIKKRLATLLESTPTIEEAIQNSLASLNGQKGDPHSFDKLEELLKSQAYRLSFWRVTNDEINYRRFFDVNDLICMRVENEDVFEAMHEHILKYVEQGSITGLRIDHVDGLFDPQHYFSRLQQACANVLGESLGLPSRDFYLLVEKILIGREQLPSQWLVFGTTGYDYLNLLNGLFIVRENRLRMKQIYDHFIEHHHEMSEIIYICKKLILTLSMSSDMHILARHLEQVSEQHRWSRDYTLETLRSALRDVIASFPVYRSYIRLDDSKVQPEDRENITTAIKQAKRRNPASEPSIFDFIESVLLLEDPPGLTEQQIHHRRDFVMRFQQITGPVTAKGVEDTAFYRYYPLASLNEVGMDPNSFGTDVPFFHQKSQEYLQKWPYTLVTTSTHDTKRSEDVRSRINVLSEIPEIWNEALHHWSSLNKERKVLIENREVPANNEEFLLYQTLIGSWPLYPMDATARAQYIDRIEKYLIKAVKEAKVHTSWINPNEAYEKGVKEFIHRILNLEPDNSFIKEFEQFIQPIVKAGMFNSLSQTILKMTIPGIPDFYQGSELWEFSLVDPDNRRPVDYSNRQHLLALLKQKGQEDPGLLVSHLMETPEDGRIKLYMTSQILNFRKQHATLFQEGDYVPLEVRGEKSQNVVAFCRTKDQDQIIVAVSRFYTQLLNSQCIDPIDKIWDQTSLLLPKQFEGQYRDILCGATISSEQGLILPLQKAFSRLPLTVLKKIV